MYSASVAALAIASITLQTTSAQSLSSTIVGCVDVGCPLDDQKTGAVCTVQDKTFGVIGLSRIPTTSSNLAGFSWSEGVAIEANPENQNRTFTKDFYFGSPPSLNLTGTGGCAVFFNQVSGLVTFQGNNTEITQGTCQDAMGSNCVDALTKRATGVDVSGLGITDACNKVQSAFTDNLDSACSGAATGGKWAGVTVKPLTGPDAPTPITSSQNSSSNCWPILPKEDNLALVSSTDTIGDFLVQTISENYFSITPILTLFYPGNGSLITQAEAAMSCMKTIGLNTGDAATQNGTDSNHKGAGDAVRPSGVALAASLAVVAGLFSLV